MHTDNIEPLAVLCLHPGISDERVEMQQRGIIELKCQLSFMSLNRFTNLKRYLVRHVVECGYEDAGYKCGDDGIYIHTTSKKPRSRNSRAIIDVDLYRPHGFILGVVIAGIGLQWDIVHECIV